MDGWARALRLAAAAPVVVLVVSCGGGSGEPISAQPAASSAPDTASASPVPGPDTQSSHESSRPSTSKSTEQSKSPPNPSPAPQPSTQPSPKPQPKPPSSPPPQPPPPKPPPPPPNPNPPTGTVPYDLPGEGSPLQEDAWKSTYADRCDDIGLDADCLQLKIVVTSTDGSSIVPAPVPDDPTGPSEYTDAAGKRYYPCEVISMDPDPEDVDEVLVPSTATIKVECVPLETEETTEATETTEGG